MPKLTQNLDFVAILLLALLMGCLPGWRRDMHGRSVRFTFTNITYR